MNRAPQGALSAGQVAAYLERIGVDVTPSATPDGLRRLHLAHLRTVPFENLDIHAGRPLRLDLGALHDKIVTGRRGGFCYELNGLFGALLTALGFRVDLVSCRVRMPDGRLSPRFDHAALVVQLDAPWLADVGFGDSFRVPHPLGAGWNEPGRRFRTRREGGGWAHEADRGDGWTEQFRIDPRPRRLVEFAHRCRWHETSPRSHFRRSLIATVAIPEGRVSVSGTRTIVTTGDHRVELPHEAPEASRFLEEHFDPEVVAALEEVVGRQFRRR